MRLVLDTDVVVAGMRSPAGASAHILRAADAGRITLLMSVPLALEYEAVCLRPEHLGAAGVTRADATAFVDFLIAMAEPVDLHFLWRPQLRDPNDEMILETAMNGQADAIVTFNLRDFRPAIEPFGIALWTPAQLLRQAGSHLRRLENE